MASVVWCVSRGVSKGPLLCVTPCNLLPSLLPAQLLTHPTSERYVKVGKEPCEWYNPLMNVHLAVLDGGSSQLYHPMGGSFRSKLTSMHHYWPPFQLFIQT